MLKGNEMKNLSNEELIGIATDYDATLTHDHIKARTELLRRLEAGDRAIKACREIVAMEIPE